MKKRSIVHVHVRCNFRDLCYPRFIIDSLSTLRPFAPHFHVNDRNLRLSIGKYIFISRIIDAISSWKNTRESNGSNYHRWHYGRGSFYNHLKEISAFSFLFFLNNRAIIQTRSKVTIFRLVANETVQTRRNTTRWNILRSLNLNLQFSFSFLFHIDSFFLTAYIYRNVNSTILFLSKFNSQNTRSHVLSFDRCH